MYNELGNKRESVIMDCLLGVERIQIETFEQSKAYMYKADGHLLFTNCGNTIIFSLAAKQRAIKPIANTDVPMLLSCYKTTRPCELMDAPKQTEWHLAITHKVGKGRTGYFVHELNKFYYNICLDEERLLLTNAVNWTLNKKTFIETNAQTKVEVNLARKGNKLIVHFINATGRHPLDDIILIHDIKVRINDSKNYKSATSLMNKKSVHPTSSVGIFEFTLPTLENYNAVILKLDD